MEKAHGPSARPAFPTDPANYDLWTVELHSTKPSRPQLPPPSHFSHVPSLLPRHFRDTAAVVHNLLDVVPTTHGEQQRHPSPTIVVHFLAASPATSFEKPQEDHEAGSKKPEPAENLDLQMANVLDDMHVGLPLLLPSRSRTGSPAAPKQLGDLQVQSKLRALVGYLLGPSDPTRGSSHWCAPTWLEPTYQKASQRAQLGS